ncbi:MAG TPA: hypothetical protein VFD38_02375 [Myxococcaceae bacterium]|nr:hypothetical protein [Myxococcaceae bacterium]
MTGRSAVGVLMGVLALGCQSLEGDTPADAVPGTRLVRWSSASSGPDIVSVGGPAGAAPRCFRTTLPARANVSTDVSTDISPLFAGASEFPAETYAAIEALFTDDVEAVLRSDSDRLRARPPGEVRLGHFLDLEHVGFPRRTWLDVRLPLDETASDLTRELLRTLLPLVDAHCPHP